MAGLPPPEDYSTGEGDVATEHVGVPLGAPTGDATEHTPATDRATEQSSVQDQWSYWRVYTDTYEEATHKCITDGITTSDETRLFTRLTCIDFPKSVRLFFRSDAMLQSARLTKGREAGYSEQVANDEIRHSLLSSLRVRVRTSHSSPYVTTNSAAATEPSQCDQAADAYDPVPDN